MKKYEFSMPMPYSISHIDEIKNINDQVEKSQITNVYFCFPINSQEKTGFEQTRTHIPNLRYFSDWQKLIEQSQKNNLDIVYILNSGRPLFIENSVVFNKQLENLDKLINNLQSSGVTKLRIAQPQLINYIAKYYPQMEIYTSTSLEYTQINQYKNLLSLFPQIKQIVPSHDTNKNFMFLKTLKKTFPNVNIELMVQEGCLKGCPFRIHHMLGIPLIYPKENEKLETDLTPEFYTHNCSKIQREDIYKFVCVSNVVYPWQIKEYAKIGITNFKFVGRNSQQFFDGQYLEYVLKYLQGIDDIKYIEDYPFHYLVHHYLDCDLHFTVKQIKPYLPKIEHFIKYGHLCASRCGIDCHYCYDCAKKIKSLKH